MFKNVFPYKLKGRILEIKENALKISLPGLKVGDTVVIESPDGKKLLGEVVSISKGISYVAPFGEVSGLDGNARVYPLSSSRTVKVGRGFLGRVVNAFNQPVDGKGNIPFDDTMPWITEPENPLNRRKITEILDVGVKVINGILTLGKGQKIGIFSGAGVGKSTLLGMIARYAKADVNVIALIGERGREVTEFIEDILGEEGLKKSIVVVSTSDDHPLVKIKAMELAHIHAEYFKNKGLSVLLLVDSLTRYAMAKREVGLAMGEPPTTKGYPPSVFLSMPKILERAGNFRNGGSITGIYTVLVEGDDIRTDPVADAAVSILDGHIVLSRELAGERIFPAVDVTKSISRLMIQLVSDEHYRLAQDFVSMFAEYQRVKDVVSIGLYKPGSNPITDRAIKLYPKMVEFIRQKPKENYSFEESYGLLKRVFSD
jgi:flagellum-specific ATP synthase